MPGHLPPWLLSAEIAFDIANPTAPAEIDPSSADRRKDDWESAERFTEANSAAFGAIPKGGSR
jgi:hypothetical protein